MTQEALKLALEALEKLDKVMKRSPDTDKAITAIKEALREHAMREVQRLGQEIEQEPVKWADYEPDGVHHNKPPQRTWVGLTDEQYFEIGQRHWLPSSKVEQIHKEIEEAAHDTKEKNT